MISPWGCSDNFTITMHNTCMTCEYNRRMLKCLYYDLSGIRSNLWASPYWKYAKDVPLQQPRHSRKVCMLHSGHCALKIPRLYIKWTKSKSIYFEHVLQFYAVDLPVGDSVNVAAATDSNATKRVLEWNRIRWSHFGCWTWDTWTWINDIFNWYNVHAYSNNARLEVTSNKCYAHETWLY